MKYLFKENFLKHCFILKCLMVIGKYYKISYKYSYEAGLKVEQLFLVWVLGFFWWVLLAIELHFYLYYAR